MLRILWYLLYDLLSTLNERVLRSVIESQATQAFRPPSGCPTKTFEDGEESKEDSEERRWSRESLRGVWHWLNRSRFLQNVLLFSFPSTLNVAHREQLGLRYKYISVQEYLIYFILIFNFYLKFFCSFLTSFNQSRNMSKLHLWTCCYLNNL